MIYGFKYLLMRREIISKPSVPHVKNVLVYFLLNENQIRRNFFLCDVYVLFSFLSTMIVLIEHIKMLWVYPIEIQKKNFSF